MNPIEYGVINLIISPNVYSGLYFLINTRIIPAYDISGEITFVDESASLYAAATTSGVRFEFTLKSIGINIGPSNIHFEVNPPTKRFIIAVTMINPINNNTGESLNPKFCKNVAPR